MDRVVSLIAALLFATAAQAQDFITVASTTSTEQSGLFKHLLPEAKKALGFDVRVVAVGTGQALDMGRKGDADVVFVLTTNRADVLEPALAARPGRVDQAVELGLPDATARRALLELYRGAKEMTVSVKLGRQPASPP